MKRHLALLFCGMLAAILAVWVVGRGSKRPPIRLPDGSWLTLQTVTYGTNHSFFFGSPWQRVQRRFPVLAKGRGGAGVNSRYDSESGPSLVFWFLWHGAVPMNRVPLQLVLVDDAGDEAGHFAYNDFRYVGNHEEVAAWATTQYPRANRWLEVRIYQPDAAGRVMALGHYRLRNPHRVEPEPWEASPLPCSGRANDLALALTELVAPVGKDLHHPQRPAPGQTSWARAVFALEDVGSNSTCEPVGMELIDSTGNYSDASTWAHERQNDRLVVHFQPALWPNDAVWRLRASFARPPAIQVYEVPVREPGAGTNSFPNRPPEPAFPANTSGNSATPWVLDAVRQPLDPAAARAPRPGPQETVSLVIDNVRLDGGERMTLVSVSDDQGRVLKILQTRPALHRYTYGLHAPPEVRTLRVTVALSGRHTLEYQVRPSRK